MSKFKFSWDSNGDEEFFNILDRNSTLGEVFEHKEEQKLETRNMKHKPSQQIVSSSCTQTNTNQIQSNSSTPVWNTQIAKVASAYKEGQLVGKVGVALLKSTDNECKVIIYKAKTNVLSTLTLTTEHQCKVLHRQCRYLQFYDDDGAYWSLLFDKKDEEGEFIAKLQELKVKVVRENTIRSDNVKNNEEINVEQLDDNDNTDNKSAGGLRQQTDGLSKESIPNLPNKASVISRVVKVGQQLPALPMDQISITTATDESDSEVFSLQKKSLYKLSGKNPQIVPINSIDVYSTSEIAQSSLNINQMEAHFMQMMLSENRTQNGELRMNLSKLDSKVDKVLDKIGSLDAKKHQLGNDNVLFELEEKLLEAKKENRKLKLALQVNENQQNVQKIKEKLLKQHKEELEAFGIAAEQDLEEVLESLLRKSKILQQDSKEKESKAAENLEQLRIKTQKLDEEIKKNTQQTDKIAELEKVIITTHKTLADKSQEIDLLQEQVNDYSKKPMHPSAEEQRDRTEHIVKSIMNKLYSTLLEKIELVPTRRRNEIFQIIGETIRSETLKALENLEDMSNSN